MQLIYRGVQYCPTHSACKTTATQHESCYRGIRHQVKTVFGVYPHKQPQQLVYRGIPYTAYF